MFKFELGQLIWYMRNNAIHNGKVLSRIAVDNATELTPYPDDPTNVDEQRNFFNRFGPTRTHYATCHGIVAEVHAHASREDLVQHLLTVA